MGLVKFIKALEEFLSTCPEGKIKVPDSKHEPFRSVRRWLDEKGIEYETINILNILKNVGEYPCGIWVTATNKLSPEEVREFARKYKVRIGSMVIKPEEIPESPEEYLEFLRGLEEAERIGYLGLFCPDLPTRDSPDRWNENPPVYVSRKRLAWIEEIFSQRLKSLFPAYTELIVEGNEEKATYNLMKKGQPAMFSAFVQTGRTLREYFGDSCEDYLVEEIPVYPIVIMRCSDEGDK